MAAAYAALLCLTKVVENLQNYGRHLLSLDKLLTESLLQRVGFFQEFLEVHSSHQGVKEMEILESRIRDAAHAAEDIIESHIVDRIRDGSSENVEFFVHQDLHKVMKDMDLIKKELLMIEEDRWGLMKTQKPVDSLHVGSPSRRALSSDNNNNNNKTMVGCEDELNRILERLTGEGSTRQVIPIVGMGGIGKTTLARNAYNHRTITEYFDIRAWVTVSQEYRVNDLLFSLLNGIGIVYDKRNQTNISESELGEQLHKTLYGRRYLIVMDDIWSVEAWEKVRSFLPSHNNYGSRILITTRLSNVANSFDCLVTEKSFLDEDKSWSLFCKEAFGGLEVGCCPHQELEEIGKKIVRHCKGLPLAIIVIGGLLAKSNKTREHWECIEEDVAWAINSEDDDHCLKLLSLSYVHLPMHLKPCFLYFGVYPEDEEIDASILIHVWVAEGFLKPIEGKSSEEAAKEYLGDLIDRNLVLVSRRGYLGEIERVRIHDLLRELCLREAQRVMFFNIITRTSTKNKLQQLTLDDINTTSSLHNDNGQWRLVIHEGKFDIHEILQSATRVTRSLICDIQEQRLAACWNSFKLLRVLHVIKNFLVLDKARWSSRDVLHFVNLRYLSFKWDNDSFVNHGFPPIHTFWNLQTLVMNGMSRDSPIVPSEIWMMRALRHLKIEYYFVLPDPPPPIVISHHRTDTDRRRDDDDDHDDFVVLENLQTLERVIDLKCSQEFVKRVPNIKTLTIRMSADSCLYNLRYLTKLEYLRCSFDPLSTPIRSNPNMIAFPCSLKELRLRCTRLDWEEMSRMIGGSLPQLEWLMLEYKAFVGPIWKPVEGEFQKLKVLVMEDLKLEHWMADDTHFPCLERLELRSMCNLVEVPLGFAEIPTFQVIVLDFCNDSVIVSAKRILEEAESLGNEDLRVVDVVARRRERYKQRLAKEMA